MRLASSLQLAAIAAFTLAVIAQIVGKNTAATMLFVVAAAGFLATIILKKRS